MRYLKEVFVTVNVYGFCKVPAPYFLGLGSLSGFGFPRLFTYIFRFGVLNGFFTVFSKGVSHRGVMAFLKPLQKMEPLY